MGKRMCGTFKAVPARTEERRVALFTEQVDLQAMKSGDQFNANRQREKCLGREEWHRSIASFI
jgi:hypothetical protein